MLNSWKYVTEIYQQLINSVLSVQIVQNMTNNVFHMSHETFNM